MNKFIEYTIGFVVSAFIFVVMLWLVILIAQTNWAINVKDCLVFVTWVMGMLSIAALWIDWDK